MKHYLRDLFWLVLVAALVMGWWVDRSRLTKEQAALHRVMPPATIKPVIYAWQKSNRKFPLKRVTHEEGGDITIGFGWGTPSVGAGETIRLKKTSHGWEVVEQYEYDA